MMGRGTAEKKRAKARIKTSGLRTLDPLVAEAINKVGQHCPQSLIDPTDYLCYRYRHTPLPDLRTALGAQRFGELIMSLAGAYISMPSHTERRTAELHWVAGVLESVRRNQDAPRAARNVAARALTVLAEKERIKLKDLHEIGRQYALNSRGKMGDWVTTAMADLRR